MHVGYPELKSLLDFCINRKKQKSLKEAAPNFWKEVSFSGRLISAFGFSRNAWWKEKYLFPFVIHEIVPYLVIIAHRSFPYREEHHLEIMWQLVSICCSDSKKFLELLNDAYPQCGELLSAPFPKFSYVRRGYQKTRLRRGFQYQSWFENETLAEYESRLGRFGGTHEQNVEEKTATTSVHPVRRATVQNFHSLGKELSQAIRSLERDASFVRKMKSDSIIMRFEDEELFFQIAAWRQEYETLIVQLNTIHFDHQAWEISGQLKGEDATLKKLIEWNSQFAAMLKAFEKWISQKEMLNKKLNTVFSSTRARLNSLRLETDKVASRVDHALHPNLIDQQLKKSKELIFSYEKALSKPPGPFCLWKELEERILGNLKFVEMLAQNPASK